MGYWTRGDYTIYIDLNTLETSFKTSSKEYDKSATYYTFSDSIGSKLHLKTALKYLEAAEILSQASNGFDLRKVQFDKDSVDYSPYLFTLPKLEVLVMNQFKSGKAAMYYKGKRVYTYKYQTLSYGKEILDHGITTTYVYDSLSNFVFQESRHLGW
jgi:hypothetical protein